MRRKQKEDGFRAPSSPLFDHLAHSQYTRMRRAAYIRFTVYSADPRIKRGGKTAPPVGQ